MLLYVAVMMCLLAYTHALCIMGNDVYETGDFTMQMGGGQVTVNCKCEESGAVSCWAVAK